MAGKKVIWITDIHLNFLDYSGVNEFIEELRQEAPAALLVGGDISEATDVVAYLEKFHQRLGMEIYFVLGNHDFYQSSIAGMCEAVTELFGSSDRLFFLNDSAPFILSDRVALVGHGCWADGRYGDYGHSKVVLNDYLLIDELKFITEAQRLKRLNELGDRAAESLKRSLEQAFELRDEVICLTHVPPFREACWHHGRISDDDYLPHFSCKAAGDVMLDVMRKRPNCRLKVLCGHTHSPGRVDILENLVVITGGAEYGRPEVQGVFYV